jgi:hypothetical protein
MNMPSLSDFLLSVVSLIGTQMYTEGIQRVSEISTLILTSSRQEQQNFYIAFFRNIIFISVSGVLLESREFPCYFLWGYMKDWYIRSQLTQLKF